MRATNGAATAAVLLSLCLAIEGSLKDPAPLGHLDARTWASPPHPKAKRIDRRQDMSALGIEPSGTTSAPDETSSAIPSAPATVPESVVPTVAEPDNIAPGSLSVEEGCSQYYIAVSGDYCLEILASNAPDLTLEGFYAANTGVDTVNCDNLVPGLAYCIAGPTNLQEGSLDLNSGCHKFHNVTSGETCNSIVESIGDVTLAEFQGWNPEVNADCTNLIDGFSYCSCDGGEESVTTPDVTTPDTSTTDVSDNSPVTVVVVDTVQPTDQPDPTSAAAPVSVSPAMATPRTRRNRRRNKKEKRHRRSGHRHRRRQAQAQNCPAAPSSTDDAGVTTPDNIAQDTLDVEDGCTQYYVPVSGDYCYSVVAQFPGLTLQGFYNLNPSVGTDNCPNLQPDLSYCVAGPDNLQQGSLDANSGCHKFHNVTVGETCNSIVAANTFISLAQFLEWNPEINTDCTNLIAGFSYCSCDGSGNTDSTNVEPAVSSAADVADPVTVEAVETVTADSTLPTDTPDPSSSVAMSAAPVVRI